MANVFGKEDTFVDPRFNAMFGLGWIRDFYVLLTNLRYFAQN